MKGVLFLLLICGFFTYSNAQSLEFFGLKGNVKSIQEELKICSNQYGKVETKDCSSSTSEKQFSTDGYFIEKERKVEGITREKKDTPSGLLEILYKEEKGGSIKFAENYFNKQKIIIKTLFFDVEGNVSRVREYFYDEKGSKSKWEEVSHVNGVKEKTISFFDEYGTFCGVEIYRNDVLSNQGKFDVRYEFDEKGNWIQSIVITDFSTDIHKRIFTYY